jgi:predicted RNA-binding Zn-ribbon protein involved in translation (DUF1610 family)
MGGMNESLFPTRWAKDRPPSLEKFTSDFADDYACADYLAKKRWSKEFRCPKCGGNRSWRLETRPWVFECKGIHVDANENVRRTDCHHQTSVIAGTVMHGTHLPLRKWFLAAYLLATHSNGISALQLQPKLGVGYKTAWLLLHKLRRAMINPDRQPLNGFIEIDETSVIFRKKTEPEGGGQGRSTRGKMFLIGAVEVVENRYPGRIRLKLIPNTTGDSNQEFIEQNTSLGCHILTDGYSAYRNPRGRGHTAHNLSDVDAPAAHVVLPWVHRVFSNFKRWTAGTYHGVRDKHVDIYCNEFVFRWNRRRHFQTNIDTMLGFGQKIGRVTWRDIVGNTIKWKHDHREQVLSMVDPQRLKRAENYAFENGTNIFDALDDIRREEPRHNYIRRKPNRPVLPPRRPGEKRNTHRYLHPLRWAHDDISKGYLCNIPPAERVWLTG